MVLRAALAGLRHAIRDGPANAATGVGGKRRPVQWIETVDRFQQPAECELKKIGPVETIGRTPAKLMDGDPSCELLITLEQAFATTRVVLKAPTTPEGCFDLTLPLDQSQSD